MRRVKLVLRGKALLLVWIKRVARNLSIEGVTQYRFSALAEIYRISFSLFFVFLLWKCSTCSLPQPRDNNGNWNNYFGPIFIEKADAGVNRRQWKQKRMAKSLSKAKRFRAKARERERCECVRKISNNNKHFSHLVLYTHPKLGFMQMLFWIFGVEKR